MQTSLQDLRYALCQLHKALGFALTAAFTLSVGIGGVTAVFSVVEAVMLRPLSFKDPGQLISLGSTRPAHQSALRREDAGRVCDGWRDPIALHLFVVSGVAPCASSSLRRTHAGSESRIRRR